MTKWTWEEVDTSRSGTSGDLSKLFRNERIKQPGLLAQGAPPPEATLLAREVIQNSWDAANELTKELEREGEEPIEFAIEFHFRDLIGAEKAQLIDELGLDELAKRASGQDPLVLGLPSTQGLEALADDGPLPVLEIRESGTTGMYGPWSDPTSKMYLALVSLGFTLKAEPGAGGSYGYGKAGLIRGSAIRTIVAYTCFAEKEEREPGVSRRLLGMTYWGRHEDGDGTYDGFARFGHSTGTAVEPLMDDAADDTAMALGLERRNPGVSEDLGTTFLLPMPTVRPGDLVEAIERSWWPALEDGAFHVEIVTADGETLIPMPKQNEKLRDFIRAWNVARFNQDGSTTTESRHRLNALKLSDGTNADLGTIGLVADPDDWSYPPSPLAQDIAEGNATEHRSLVALMRSPQMVVEYLEVGTTAPFVRGAFIADAEADEHLRQVEPRAHDSWEGHSDADGIDPRSPEVAKAVVARVKSRVREFRNKIRPTVPKADDIRLPELDSLFRQLLHGKGKTPAGPRPTRRDVSIGIKNQQLVPVRGDDGIRLEATATFALSSHVERDEAIGEVGIRYLFVEDERVGSACRLDITAPAGFELQDESTGVFVGPLTHDAVAFVIRSDPYQPDWTGRLVASAELTAADTESEPAE